MGTGEINAAGNPAMDWHPIQGGVEIFLVASCHGNRDKLRPDMGHLARMQTLPFLLYIKTRKGNDQPKCIKLKINNYKI